MGESLNFDPTKAFNDAMDSELAERPNAEWQISGRASVAHPHGEDEGWWRTKGPEMVQRWIDWRDNTPWDLWISPDGTLGVELEILHPVGGELIKMYIDRIFATGPNNTRPVIVDIKTGRPPESNLQLGLYAAAVESLWPGVKVAGGTYWMARTGETTGVQSLAMYTPRLIGEYMRRLRVARAGGVFLPKVSSFCRTCKVGKFCAANNGSEAYMDPDFELMGGA